MADNDPRDKVSLGYDVSMGYDGPGSMGDDGPGSMGTEGPRSVGHGGPGHARASTSRRTRRIAGTAGVLLVGGIAGGALAATSTASAAGTSPASTATAFTAALPGPGGHADNATPVRPGEKAETGTDLSNLRAAALKAVPGGTVYRVETDADGAAYEAHMTKADGTHVTVKFGKNFAMTAVEQGMGAGGPGGPPGGAAGPGAAGGSPGTTPPSATGSGV